MRADDEATYRAEIDARAQRTKAKAQELLLSSVELDIATAVARIEQIARLPEDDSLRAFLLDRLITCDAPRLRRHLGAEALAALAEARS